MLAGETITRTARLSCCSSNHASSLSPLLSSVIMRLLAPHDRDHLGRGVCSIVSGTDLLRCSAQARFALHCIVWVTP